LHEPGAGDSRDEAAGQPDHVVFLEGVSLDRTDQGRTPRFLPGEPPTDTDIADVVQQISQCVLRTLRQIGYLEAGIDAAVATGYDILVDDEPEFTRTMAAAVQQRIIFGERAGQKFQRIRSGFGTEGEQQRSCRCRASIWCALAGVWRRTAAPPQACVRG
jgi:hypothetical protein